MSRLRTATLELAASLPVGSPARKRILAVLERTAKVPEIVVDMLDDDRVFMKYPEPNWRDLVQLSTRRIHLPFPGRNNPHIEYAGPEDSPAKALKAGEKLVKDYQKRQWPGGMGSVVALIKWDDSQAREKFPDHMDGEGGDKWSAVANLYYSPS